ncbi:MAG TPA: HNH endonuclease [Azospirillum sp.]|nr:HNH endonuclease [Azospirillum sp.]
MVVIPPETNPPGAIRGGFRFIEPPPTNPPGTEMDHGVVSIPLSRGMVATIDAADAALVAPHKWHAVMRGGISYAATNMVVDGKKRPVLMHRFLLNAPTGTVVDHISGDGLDNRKSNLRICTAAENIRNQKARVGCTSRFKGVRYRADTGKWSAEIQYQGKQIHLGTFVEEVAAARQYDRASRLMFGSFAKTNAMLGLYS